MLLYYALASLLGAVVGASEIVSRYRDAPYQALRTASAWFYVVLNAVASLSAFTLVRNLDAFSSLGGTTEGPGKLLIQALTAGVSAMALFRTSLFMIRVGNADIGIGPAAFLQILLSATDRATDRARAKPRADAVQKIMGGISFALAKEALPSLCFGLMQGLTPEEQVTFGVGVKALEASAMEDAFKANSLGLSLMNIVGEDVLLQAVNMLRGDISAKPKPIVQSILTLKLLQSVDFNSSKTTIVDGCLFVANRMLDFELAGRLASALQKIDAMKISENQKVLFLSSLLIVNFGEDTLQYVLRAVSQAAAAPKAEAAAFTPPTNPSANVVAIHPAPQRDPPPPDAAALQGEAASQPEGKEAG